MLQSLLKLRNAGRVLTFVLAGVLVFSFSPVATLAEDNAEQEFRGFEPVSFSEESLLELEALIEDLDPLTMLLIYMEIQNLFEFETDLSEENIREVRSAEELEAHLDGELSLPTDLPAQFARIDPEYIVLDEGYAAVTIDVASARRISQLLDLPVDWLPSPREQSHLTVRLDVPNAGAAVWENRGLMLVIGQSATPELDIPDELDLDALRDALVADDRIPDDIASQFSALDGRSGYLPIPIPPGAEYEEITVNGNEGLLISIDMVSALILEDEGTINFIAGTVTAQQIQDLAEEMQ